MSVSDRYDLSVLKHISKLSRLNVVKMTHEANTSHVASCLSVIDILVAAYSLKKIVHSEEKWEVLLSKGHAAAGLYSVLYEMGDINLKLDDYCKDDSHLYGHVNHHASPDIPLSTGSLGHGAPFGMGIALAKKARRETGKVIVIISDGECNEGTTWETAMVANQNHLDNLILVIDRNRFQSLGLTEEINALEPLKDKWCSFGWETIEVDGHDLGQLTKVMSKKQEKPLCIIANTTKGRGVSFMEDTVEWHYKSPDQEQLAEATRQIESSY
jgi:transketolase